VEGERVVERAAAGLDHDRHEVGLPAVRRAARTGASQSSGAWKLPRSGGTFGQRCEPRAYSIVPPSARVSSSATQQMIISTSGRTPFSP
jgi:hypothetical protein